MLLAYLFSGPYDRFKGRPSSGIYYELGVKTKQAEIGIYQLVLTAGVFISAASFLVAAIMLVIAGRKGGVELQKAKSFWLKVLLVSILVFGVTGIINLVQGVGLDAKAI